MTSSEGFVFGFRRVLIEFPEHLTCKELIMCEIIVVDGLGLVRFT